MGEPPRVWPNPKHTEAEKLEVILELYRLALMEADEQACRNLDGKMWRWGQGWISEDGVIYNPDRLMSARQIQIEYGIQTWKVFDWARRHPDLIPKLKKDGRVLFRLGDVREFKDRHKKKNQYG